MEDGRLVMRLSSQMPTGVRTSLVAALPGLTTESVRVLVGDVGGGFGMKTGIYPEDIAVAHAAMLLGRPVKWQAERIEDFLSAVQGRGQINQAEMALDADGHVLAMRVRTIANVGAYPSGASVAIPLLVGPWVTSSVYHVPCIDLRITAVLTNCAATGAYRGAGRPESIYLTERLMDEAARVLRLDPAELRRRNLVRPEQMPYTNVMGQTYDSGAFERMLDQGLTLADWAGFDARRQASEARGRHRGRSVTSFLEWTGGGALQETVGVRVTGDGFVELTSATMAMGQGIATSYAQLAVDVFGVPIERIRVLQGDTDRANGFGSAGSRSLFTGGSAVRIAAERSVEQGKALAAKALEAPAADIEYRAGRFSVAGTDLGIDLFELAARQDGASFAVEDEATAGGPSWPNGCHVCEVELDPATGAVEIVAYASVNDIGTVVSPEIVRGQVEGGAVQGIGQALCEQVVYDDGGGQLQSASFMDYALPRVDGFRGFVTRFDTSVPCRTNSLGAKGVGELGTIGATPAVVNAVVDALARAGVPDAAQSVQMPLTAEVVWRALQSRAG
jgi:carbon-monoxide dehydrogenase large subunit